MDNRFEPLAMGEVLSISESAQILIGHHTFRVSEFAEAIRTQLEYGVAGWTEDKNAWFSEKGVPCEVLRFSSNGWQKGKVRINLEFCPQDEEDEEDEASVSFDADYALGSTTSIEDELDLGESSDAFDEELALATSALADNEEEPDWIEESPASEVSDSFDEGLDLAELTDSEDEQDQIESSINQLDELDLGTPASTALDDELGQEEPAAIYFEMEQEASIIISEDALLDTTEMSTDLDDDFDLGEISESIEQELELVENPAEEDLLDLSEMSATDEDDLDFGDISVTGEDDLDFGDISSGSEDEFQLDDISLNNESENNETDSLLDDVWQDMNEASWQNK